MDWKSLTERATNQLFFVELVKGREFLTHSLIVYCFSYAYKYIYEINKNARTDLLPYITVVMLLLVMFILEKIFLHTRKFCPGSCRVKWYHSNTPVQRKRCTNGTTTVLKGPSHVPGVGCRQCRPFE